MLKLELAVAPSTNWLSIDAVINRTYTLQSSPALGTGAWLKLLDVPAGTNAARLSIPQPAEAASRYYRLLIPALP